MGLSTIIDKSALQSFNGQDVDLLYRYYLPNIPSILVMEILGDLSKTYEDGTVSIDKVKQLANKLLPNNTAVNANYLDLIREELEGAEIIMDYRPLVGNVERLKSASGMTGMKISESAEQIAIRHWKDGHFTHIEELTALLWRKVTKQEDLLEKLKKDIRIDSEHLRAIRTFEDVAQYVDRILTTQSYQIHLLDYAFAEFGIGIEHYESIYRRWLHGNTQFLKSFAPYTYYCLKVVLLFHVGLKKGLVGTRPTNQLDLEYLFYLPFCRVFVSDDKFQKNMASLLMTEEQSLVTGSELKADFKLIYEYIKTVGERKMIERLRREPPQIPSLLTYQLWNKYFHWPSKLPPPTVKEEERAYRQMREIFDAVDAGTLDQIKSGEIIDFVIVESQLRLTDPCPCGSGKPIKDCHMPGSNN